MVAFASPHNCAVIRSHAYLGVPHPVVFMPAAMPLIVARTVRSTA